MTGRVTADAADDDARCDFVFLIEQSQLTSVLLREPLDSRP